jgi:hypothetical protein
MNEAQLMSRSIQVSGGHHPKRLGAFGALLDREGKQLPKKRS